MTYLRSSGRFRVPPTPICLQRCVFWTKYDEYFVSLYFCSLLQGIMVSAMAKLARSLGHSSRCSGSENWILDVRIVCNPTFPRFLGVCIRRNMPTRAFTHVLRTYCLSTARLHDMCVVGTPWHICTGLKGSPYHINISTPPSWEMEVPTWTCLLYTSPSPRD